MPMRAYRVVQAGAKNPSGGVQEGLGMRLYHPSLAFPPMAPTTTGVPAAPATTCANTHGVEGGKAESAVVEEEDRLLLP